MMIRARGRERGRVLSWPRPFAANPYLGHLADALADEGITTIVDRYLASLVAVPRAARWLHLHWPEWMIVDRSPARGRARAWWLWRLLDRAKSRGLGVAWTAHNLAAHDDPNPEFGRVCRRELLARCDVVFGHFPSAEADVRELGFRGRFVCAPHPGYLAEAARAPTRARAREGLGYGEREFLVVAFGAIEPYKGFAALAEAFAAADVDHARLLVAGEPRSRLALESLVRASAGCPRVRLEMRHVPPDQVSRIFAAADLTVLPYEAFYTSGTAMLALSHGCPVAGPPVHHLATLRPEPFFVAMSSPREIGTVLEVARKFDAATRASAAAYARRHTWASSAAVIAAALFGATPR